MKRFSLVLFGVFAGTQIFAQTNSVATVLPDVIVVSKEVEPGFKENRRVGANEQPEWTTQRRFPTTRVYVMAPWQVEFEQWWKGKFLRGGGHEHLFQSEVEVGLPYRLQLDLYENVLVPDKSGARHDGNQVELRYALADWGKIPLNPTLYGEWKFNEHDADAYEVKFLLGEDFSRRVHWGFNAFYEQEVGGGRRSEVGFAQGLSYTLIDQKLSAGVEMNFERSSGPNFDGSPSVEFLLGPSVQWRPSPRTHLDLVPLFGLTHDSPRVEAFIVFGIDLARGQSHYVPTSALSK